MRLVKLFKIDVLGVAPILGNQLIYVSQLLWNLDQGAVSSLSAGRSIQQVNDDSNLFNL